MSSSRPQTPGPSGPSPIRPRMSGSLRPQNSYTSLRSLTGPVHTLGTSSLRATLPPHLSSVNSSDSVPHFDTSRGDRDSVISVNGSLGAMVATTSEIEVNGEGEVEKSSGDAKLALRDSLRRNLSITTPGDSTTRRPKLDAPTMNELQHEPADQFPVRQYFILTNAGKPVFTSKVPVDSDSDDLTSAMGLIQALISVFADDGDKIRCINAGRTRISFLLRSPLYYVCVSSWREPESVTRVHLDYLHQHILSVVSGGQLRKIFERRNNFDLRRLLDGTDTFLHSLISRLENDMGLTTASLGAVRLDSILRAKVGDIIVPPRDMRQDILYVLLISRSLSRVITLSRPKKQSIHPSDLHILLNTLSSPSLSSNSVLSSSSWLPICLPKYSGDGFLHVYVSFLKDRLDTESGAQDSKDEQADEEQKGSQKQEIDENEIGLVIVTPRRDDFERMRGWADTIDQHLRASTNSNTASLLESLIHATKNHRYSPVDLAIPGLRHFFYKSRPHVQITMPAWERSEPYDDLEERKRLITLYQCVHDALHARSGQAQGPLKLTFIRTEREIVMGWVTQPFELLITLSPHMTKSAVVGAANAVAKWVKKEESRLFIRDAPVF